MNLNNSLHKKINRRTTYAQFQKLVDQMEAFPHLATGKPVFKFTKSAVNAAWKTIAQTLNAIGPPERTVLEWIKTWEDLKSRTKQNIADNSKSFSLTGGGSCPIKSLTALELQIDKLCHLSSAAAPQEKLHGLKCSISSSKSNYDKSPPRTSFKVAVVTPTRSNELSLSQKSASSPPTFNTPTKMSPIFISLPGSTSTPLPISSPNQITKILTRKRKDFQAAKENEEELQLLRKQVVTQEAILRVMESQAKSAEEQAKYMKDIAESAKVMAKTMSDLIQYLNHFFPLIKN